MGPSWSYGGLQLPMQPVPITTKVVSSNPIPGGVCSIQHYVIKFVSRPFFRGNPFSSTKKTDRRYVAEILLKVALNIITLTLTLLLCVELKFLNFRRIDLLIK